MFRQIQRRWWVRLLTDIRIRSCLQTGLMPQLAACCCVEGKPPGTPI